MALNLFRTKSPEHLMAEAAAPERQLKRALSAFDLTCIGIGAIIGTGIFALAGTAAAGEQAHAVGSIWKTPVLNFVQSWTTHAPLVFGRPGAGPAVMLSFVVAGIACGFAALCYAELAAMIPVSGSAYAYAYATLGEIIAWTIGWDLILEYAVGSMTVAIGWSGYMQRLLAGFGIHLPAALAAAPRTVPGAVFNLPAVLIVLAITTLLVIGIRESARFNATMVFIKLAAVLFFIVAGFKFVKPENWSPFAPYGWSGIMAAGAVVFFAYIGFDAVSTTAEEARNPKRDLPIGIIASLVVCTLLYIVVAGILSG